MLTPGCLLLYKSAALVEILFRAGPIHNNDTGARNQQYEKVLFTILDGSTVPGKDGPISSVVYKGRATKLPSAGNLICHAVPDVNEDGSIPAWWRGDPNTTHGA